ncbi:MAG: hypothetical protein IJP29_05345 [Lachnospiraceae bacterium]|nr:hypothetical protein [Lachnospiraceae bacterium]
MGKKKTNRDEQKNNENGAPKENRQETTNKVKEIVITALVGVLMLVVVVFGLWKLSGEDDKPSNTLAFTVGTEEVYMDEVNLVILQNIQSTGMTVESLDRVSSENKVDAATVYKEEMLEVIMDYKVAYLVAKERGMELTAEELEDVKLDVADYLSKVDARLLNQWGIEKSMIQEVYEQRYLAHKLETTITDGVEVGEYQYCTVYFMLFPKVEMTADGSYATEEDGETPIMLSDSEIEQAKADADAALAELKAGTDPDEVAKTYGVESYSGQESNISTSFDEVFTKYTTTLKAEECSPVIELESCYAIVKMITENNEEMAEQIVEYYEADKMQEALDEQRALWYEQVGVGEEPEYAGKAWSSVNLYNYLQ